MAIWTRQLCVLGLVAAICGCGGPSGLTDPDSLEGLLDRAQTAMLSGQNEKAQALAQEAIARDPQSARGHILSGMIYRLADPSGDQEALGQKEIQSFTRAVELSPDSIAARTNLAASMLRQGQSKAAAEHLSKLADLSNDAPWSKNLTTSDPHEHEPPIAQDQNPAQPGQAGAVEHGAERPAQEQ